MSTIPKHNPPAHHFANDMTNDEIDLSHLFSTILFYKWRILWFTVFCGTLGTIYAFSSSPVYQADAMLEITGTKNQVLGELSDLIGGNPTAPIDTEIELIKSRLILGKSVRDLGLDLVVKPKISRWEKLLPKSDDLPPEISIGEFQVNPMQLNKPFTFIASGETEYKIVTPDKQTYSGTIGRPVSLGEPGARIIVNRIRAPFGQEFTLTKYSQLASIGNIRQNLSVAAKGKNVPVLNLSLTGTDPEAIQNTLNRIIANYTEHNRNKDVQTATSSLKFISEELPRLEEKLREAENSLNNYRAKTGSLDVPNEARTALDSLNKIEMQMVDLRTEESVLSEVYTREHPAYKALQDKIKVLQQAKERLNRQISHMPETQQSIIRLTRDVEINQAIYVQLLNKRQELSILSASSQGNVRLIDQAVTAEYPIKPRKTILMALATMFGLFLSSMYYLVKSFLKRGIVSEEELVLLGLDVLGSLPLSETQSRRDHLFKKLHKNKNARANSLLALSDPTDVSVEALRALRTHLHFRSLEQDNKIVLISGATPEVGKSFVSANLAVLMAQAGRKVLLIDGDMRKGYLHILLEGDAKHQGLSNILMQAAVKNYHEFVQKTNVQGLSFIGMGTELKNPSELLSGQNLPDLLKWGNAHYDHVIVDTPPILMVTDAAVIGQYVGTTLLVSRFGKTEISELNACLMRFDVNKVKVDGVILNGIERNAKNYHGYYNQYARYQSKSQNGQITG